MIPRCRLVVPANNQSNVKSEADYVPLSQHYDEKQEGMTAAFDGNPPQLHAKEEHDQKNDFSNANNNSC